jgi:hypothetical protein
MSKEELKEKVRKELTAWEEELWLTFATKHGELETATEAARIMTALNTNIQKIIDEEYSYY